MQIEEKREIKISNNPLSKEPVPKIGRHRGMLVKKTIFISLF